MPDITVNVRPSTGQIFQISFDPEETTVEGLKVLIGEKMGNLDASSLKLVFSGRILKSEDTAMECRITAGSTVHVVRSGGNKAPVASNASTSTTNTNTATTTPATLNTTSSARQTSDPIPPIPPTPSPSTLTGLGGNSSSASPFGDMQMPNMDPEVMRQMMDSPFMQNIMGNTDFVRSIIMSNPQMKALVEQNPELGHVINDPAFLRQSMEMMRNPELMREMQRNNDRALSNIEAIPGGFNHLRRMYNTFQSPMESALGRGGSSSSDEANNQRLARELNVESVPENSLNTQALPNPWAAPANNNNTNRNATDNTSSPAAAPANPFAALGGAGANGAANPLAALLGGSSGSMFPFGNNETQAQAQAQTQQPSTQQQQTPFWADPNFIQASLRMQQAMMAGQQNTGNSTSNTTSANNQQQNLLQQMMMGFPAGGFGGYSGLSDFQSPQQQQQQQPSEPPEVRFREQLAQLEEMGFSEKSSNVRALLATGGNVQAAIEYLLSM
ncbi:Vacuolar inheritance and morphology protein [Mucor velutinosus]|uniref:Ubiquilin n=1 Tax=Mucor velutinosus TaxID=708070 RepID=A0AAN7DP01_9FUNG|nr:Vacuolar inheritance and morphology protein [Mucor velutinosus]